MRKKIQIITTTCKRCGKEISTLNKVIWGTNEMKEKYGRICSSCMPVEEREEMDEAFKQAIQSRVL